MQDGIYNNMTAKDWNLSLRPKLKATRNLHELLPADLDFFVCLSSIAGIIGNRGQANYNAGNNYQDALMHHRAASGLAATSLNLSLVVGVGVSTEQENVFQLLKNGDLIPQNETDVLNLVTAAVSGRAPTQVAIGTATGGQLDKSSSNDPYWFDDSRFCYPQPTGSPFWRRQQRPGNKGGLEEAGCNSHFQGPGPRSRARRAGSWPVQHSQGGTGRHRFPEVSAGSRHRQSCCNRDTKLAAQGVPGRLVCF